MEFFRVRTKQDAATFLRVPELQGKRRARYPITFFRMNVCSQRVHVDAYDIKDQYSFDVEDVRLLSPQEYADMKHAHDYFEIMFITRGSCSLAIESGVYTYNTGDVLLFNRNISHAELILADTYFEACYLGLDKSYFEDYPEQFGSPLRKGSKMELLIGANLEEDQKNRKAYIVFLPEKITDEIPVLLAELERTFKQNGPCVKLEIYTLVAKILCAMDYRQQYTQRHIDLGVFPELEVAEKVKAYIDACHGCATREKIAEDLNYTPDHVYRTFKKIYGISVKEGCQQAQMKYVCHLLESTDASISSVMSEINCENKTQFYKVFARYYGCTPKEYRNKLLQVQRQE